MVNERLPVIRDPLFMVTLQTTAPELPVYIYLASQDHL